MRRLNRPPITIKLLDFGCGSGVIARDAVALGLQVTGVDNSQAMIDETREQLSGFGAQVNLECIPSSSGEGRYAEERYDIVLCLVGSRVYSGYLIVIVPALRSNRRWRIVGGISTQSQELAKND